MVVFLFLGAGVYGLAVRVALESDLYRVYFYRFAVRNLYKMQNICPISKISLKDDLALHCIVDSRKIEDDIQSCSCWLSQRDLKFEAINSQFFIVLARFVAMF